jgi:CBS domain-containing protein
MLTMSPETVRDAMVPEPTTLADGASAQEAGRSLAESGEVRAIFVTEGGGRLIGVVTRKTLVREVVAAGRDPGAVTLREIAEPPNFTLDAGLELEGAFRFLEEQDLERVPVVEADGRLVGVLSRAVVQRRLAETEPIEDEPPEGEPPEGEPQDSLVL